MRRGGDALGGTAGVELGTELRAVDVVEIEVVVVFPVGHLLELRGRDVGEVNDGHVELVSHRLEPRCEVVGEAVHYALLLINVRVSRGESGQDGVSAEGSRLTDVAAQVFAV